MRAVMQRTWFRIPIAEMDMHEWFVPAKLKESWPRAKGVCRRLGQNPDGRVNCEWRPHINSDDIARFTMPGGVIREVLLVTVEAVAEAA